MLWVGLGAVCSEQGPEAEFEVAHGHDAVDGPLAEFGDQSEDFGRLSRNNAIQAGSLAGDGGAGVACIARNVIPGDNPPVYCVQDSRYDSIIPANPTCTH